MLCMEDTDWFKILLWVRHVRLRQFPKHADSADSRDYLR